MVPVRVALMARHGVGCARRLKQAGVLADTAHMAHTWAVAWLVVDSIVSVVPGVSDHTFELASYAPSSGVQRMSPADRWHATALVPVQDDTLGSEHAASV